MRIKSLALLMSFLVMSAASVNAQEAVLAVEDTCADAGATGVVVQVTLDNSAVGDVAGFQFDLYFDKTALTVTDVAKTERSEEIDIFSFNETENGMRLVATGIAHTLSGTTGPIADITFDVDAGASGDYDLTIVDELVSDPLATEYPVSVVNGVFSVPCEVPGEEAVLALEDEGANPGESGVVYVTLDNSAVGKSVAAGEMTIGFDKSVFTVTAVDKTDRSQEIDIFSWNEHEEGIKFVFTGIGHYIAPGTGPIAEISMDVAAGSEERFYDWTLSETILADSMGTPIPHTTVDLSYPVSVQPVHPDVVPTHYALSQNYPNPFNPETSFDLSVPASGWVNAVIYNVMGQRVRELVDGELPAGYYTLSWDGLNYQGEAVTSGVYFCQVKAGEFSSSIKMLLLK